MGKAGKINHKTFPATPLTPTLSLEGEGGQNIGKW
jgi:hypothetical protein